VIGVTDLLIGKHLMQTAQDVVRAGLLALGSDNRRLFLSHISEIGSSSSENRANREAAQIDNRPESIRFGDEPDC
jgi:hypothetical protein